MYYLLGLLCLLISGIFNPVMAKENPVYPRPSYLYNWSDSIAEDQVFVVRFNTPVDEKSLQSNSYCHIQGLGEQVGVRIINGKLRNDILQSLYFSDSELNSEKVHLLQCKRMLPANAKMELYFGPGIKELVSDNTEPLASKTAYKYGFQVRDQFKADFSCTRPNANAACSPLYPIKLSFSSPIETKYLSQILLTRDGQNYQPDQISDQNTTDNLIQDLSFTGPFPENSNFTLSVAADIQDDLGRSLSNASSFPLDIAIGELPPLVKFVTGDFGIVERFADGLPEQNPIITVPVAVRRVGSELLTQELEISAGKIKNHVLTDSVQAINWLAKVKRLQTGQMSPGQFSDVLASSPMRDQQSGEALIDVRSKSIFDKNTKLNTLDLPGVSDLSGPDIEMVGIPISDPGLHIIEIASPALGKSLLAAAPGNETMYVRSAVLVSNMAVHIKTGRDDILVWVTSLNDGRPVPDADIRVFNCDGTQLLTGKTDESGIWHKQEKVDAYDYCDSTGTFGIFVTANIAADNPMAYGKDDFSFAWSSWDRGIEPWRFDIPYSSSSEPDLIAHAVLDRSLFHTGEKVAIKAYMREQNRLGLQNPSTEALPEYIRISHVGSAEEFKLPIQWQKNSGGGVFALAEFDIADNAKLGEYSIDMPVPAATDWQPYVYAGGFRVESFKLPLLQGSLKIMPADGQPTDILIAPDQIQADMQLTWVSGGAAANIDTSLSAISRPLDPYFPDYAKYSFSVPQELLNQDDTGVRRLILDKQATQLSADGAAIIEISDLPNVNKPQNWLFEMSFKDPNGQLQTIAQAKDVWPADVIIGIESGRWFSRGDDAVVKLLVLDTKGKPVSDHQVQLDGRQSTTFTTRKRLVGGFYAYDSHNQETSLGTLCSGKTDNNGVLSCSIKLEKDGEIQLIAKTKDNADREARAGASISVWGQDAWFGSANNDRIDLIPDKTIYKPGDVAELTINTPFAHAQALVAIEREGVLEAQVYEISSTDPVVKIPIQAGWGPNVYVSVLAVRGRLRAVPWASFFDWGWQNPVAWYQAKEQHNAGAPQPTAMVDLAKPAYRFGISKLLISDESDHLSVKVSTDKDIYQVQETIQSDIQVNLPDGTPAVGASVAFAAVDEALLELLDNNSWDVLSAMRQERSYGVSTATAQGEVVGRRHYGRKAIPAGGGGGKSATRELFDTLLLWQGDLLTDDQGKISITVPMNDSITKFRLIAVADFGQDKFGTGMTNVISTQDLQLVSGLPQIVRENDNYLAELTVRNRSNADMEINLYGKYEYPADSFNELTGTSINLAAGTSETITWEIKAPELDHDFGLINWWFTANSEKYHDAIKLSQQLLPKVPTQVFKADLLHLRTASNNNLLVSAPDNALRDKDNLLRGGVAIHLQSSLAGSLPGVYEWLKDYPFTCIEQLSAKYMGMQDLDKWQKLMTDLPKYQSDNGLLSFFPNTAGSVVLTAQIIEITAFAEDLGWPYVLPRRVKDSLITALQDFVYGRLQDQSWPNQADDFWTKLIAINALVKANGWQNGMLDSLYVDIRDWPTAALVTWMSILQEIPEFPDKKSLLEFTNQTIKSRITQHGTTIVLDDESVDEGWWLMSNQVTAQARFLLAALKSDYWHENLHLIFNGLLALQKNGHWQTTSANVLGVLAVNAFSQQYQSNAGRGLINISVQPDNEIGDFDWQFVEKNNGFDINLPWPADGSLNIDFAQNNSGSGWATVVASAAIEYESVTSNGITINRQITPVSKAVPDYWSVGDIYKISLSIDSNTDIFWAVISDPVPAGASILGSDLGRDSTIARVNENNNSWNMPSYIERDTDMFRAYYEYFSKGKHSIEYTVRLNSVGDFSLPPTRVSALYQPDVFGAVANSPVNIEPSR